MRYIDSNSRDAADALGSWLEQHVLNKELAALRWQAGFFGGEILDYFAPSIASLRTSGGPLRVLIGSNNGVTRSKDITQLLQLAGPPRADRSIGVVSFTGGLYHPKTVHITRMDGSAAAYVGSANLTKNGITSLNIEAGILLDSRDGDDVGCLADIAAAVDWWFAAKREGMTVVQGTQEVDALITAGVLDRPLPPPSPPTDAKMKSRHGTRLKPLVKVPAPAPPEAAAPAPLSAPVAEWTKKLSASDAQRKKAGNQRGSISLVRAGYNIDAQKYFRRNFFAGEPWVKGTTSTGVPRETATIQFATTVLGIDLGTVPLMVSYAPNREADQNNYTSLLHIEGISDEFRDRNLTDKWLQLTKDASGRFGLAITNTDPRT
ncbi:phospholipase D family protein [Sphingomonas sp. BN140010]|uniref:Phospholipase D family protein n=1 Tax=Sphingomonas arvum TaxID=2992113 RepID=A0ABT3JE78_9SPHN|nr:phospholipase D family protein [Sphingomonas sp. BN140010]MCW3797377.1 phospholipase D family protein [Sphingomonas sp. BN140010]